MIHALRATVAHGVVGCNDELSHPHQFAHHTQRLERILPTVVGQKQLGVSPLRQEVFDELWAIRTAVNCGAVMLYIAAR